MKIGIIMYGGIGDHLLANRLVPAVLQYYKIDKVDIIRPYLNNIEEYNGLNNPYFIAKSFNYYSEVIHVKKLISTHQDIWIDMQQTTNEFAEFNQYDKIFNFVPDAMIWPTYSHLPIAKHFKYFPQPNLNLENNDQDYIFFFPVARENQHELHKIPISLSKQIVEFANKNKLKTICPISEGNLYLKEYCKEINLETKVVSLDDMWQFAKNCKAAISCDSGPRYFPLHFGKPTLLLTGIINEPFLVRWLLNMNTTMHIDSTVENVFQRLSSLMDPLSQSIYY